MSKRNTLKQEFYKGGGRWKDLEGNPTIEYVNWLEDRITKDHYTERIVKREVTRELTSWINFLVDNKHNVTSEGIWMEFRDRIHEINGQLKIK